MGILDDAIREHLELKRQRGATDEEVERQENEAFGRARGPEPASAPEAAEPQPPEAEPQEDFARPPAEQLEAAEPQANGQPAEHPEPAAYEDLPASTFEPDSFEPDEVPPEESLQPEVTVRDTREPSGARWDDTPDQDDRDEARDEPARDPLQETPEFLEESPEEDRLWFEQRPPKDFDFD